MVLHNKLQSRRHLDESARLLEELEGEEARKRQVEAGKNFGVGIACVV